MTDFDDNLQYVDVSGEPDSSEELTNLKMGPDSISSGVSASREAAQAALISSDEDPTEAFERYLVSPNKGDIFQQNYLKYQEAKRNTLLQESKDITVEHPDLEQYAIKQIPSVQQQFTNSIKDPVGAEKTVAEELTDIEDPQELTYKDMIANDMALRMAASNDMAKLVEEAGWGETAINLASFLIPFSQTKDINDLTVSLQDSGLEFAQDSGDIKEIITKFHALPMERKVAYWPEIKKMVVEAADDNELKAAQFLTAFLDPIAGADSLILDKRVDAASGAFDIITLGAVRRLLTKIATMGNILATGKKLSSAERAANLNTIALLNKKGAQGLGTDTLTAVNTAFPVKIPKGLDFKYTDGLSSGTLTNLADFQDKLNHTWVDFKQDRLAIRDGLLNDVEKKVAINKRVAELKADPLSEEPDNTLFIKDGYHLENIDPVEIGEDYGVITYDIKHPTTGRTIAKGKEKVFWTEDGILNNFDKTFDNLTDAQINLGHPTSWSVTGEFGDFLSKVEEAGRLETTSTTLRGALSSLAAEAFSPVAGPFAIKSRNKVNKVLLHGDEVINGEIRGKDFTAEELRQGVRTKWGDINLNEKEIEAYMKTRQLVKFMHHIRDAKQVDKYRLLGIKKVSVPQPIIENGKVVGINYSDQLGKPFEKAGEANRALSGEKVARVYDPIDGNKVVTATNDFIKEQYAKGKKLVRLSDDSIIKTIPEKGIVDSSPDEIINYILVDSKAVKNLPDHGVLRYKPGYIPKINKDVEFLVKEKTITGVMNGKEHVVWRTHRFTGSKKDAEAYKAFLEERDAASGGPIQPGRYAVLSDREQVAIDVANETSTASTGLYTGHRASEDILYGPPHMVTPGDRLDVIDALQRYMGNLSRVMARQEWRMGLEEQWVRKARSELGYFNVKGFHNTPLDQNTLQGRKLEHMRRVIKMWNSIPTKEESALNNTIQRIHDFTLNGVRKVGGKNVSKISPILWMKHKDPFAAAKSAAFHPLLGMYNPVQLWVQSQNMAIALSSFKGLHAEDSLLALKDAAAMSLLDNILDPDAARAQYRILASSKDEAREIQKIHEMWMKSGYADSVRTNPDIEAITQGRWLSKSVLKRTLLDPMVFYRTGELANRRVSFAMAYRLAKRAAGGKDPDPKVVLNETNKFLMNLGRYNAARWQGGPDENFTNNVLSVLTQFKQVTAKATDNLVLRGANRNGFTVEQKAKMIGGQVFLYGAAGVPFGTWIGSQIASMQPDWDTLSEEDRTQRLNMWNQFAVGILFRDMFGAEVEVSKRGAILASTIDEVEGFTKLIDDAIFGGGDNSSAPKITTAFGSVVGRASEAMSMIKPIMLNSYYTGEVTQKDMELTVSYLKDVASSGRNISKMLNMMNNHIILSGSGDPIVIRDFNTSTELATGFGLKPMAEESVRNLDDYVDSIQAGRKQTADRVEQLMYQHLILDGNKDPEMADRVSSIIQTMLSDKMMDQADATAVIKLLESRRQNPTTKEQKAIKRWIEIDGPAMLHKDLVLFLKNAGMNQPKVGIDVMRFGEPKQVVGEEE